MADCYTFPNNAHGLAHAWECALHLRAFSYATRLAVRQWGRYRVVTVIAMPPERPTRAERGCYAT
jgi:hypothetical protein